MLQYKLGPSPQRGSTKVGGGNPSVLLSYHSLVDSLNRQGWIDLARRSTSDEGSPASTEGWTAQAHKF
jgi:hypothetical protein